MMLAVSNAFNEAFKSDLREVKMRIKINDVTYTDEDIISFNFNSGSIVGETFAIGSTYANSIKLTLCKIVEGLKQLDVVIPEMGIVLPGGGTEYVKLGTFLISEEVNPDRNENRTSLECTDRMLMLDDFYESKLKYPAEIRAVALEIANLAGVEVDKVSFGRLRQDKIKQPIGYTYREAIGLIAQFEAGYATFDRNGLLAIRLLEDKDYRVTPDEYFLKGLVKNELMFRPAGIQVAIGDEEEKFLTIGNKKGSVIKLENKLMTENLLKSIYEKVKTVNYYPYSLNWRGNPAVETGDWLRVTDTKGNQFKVPNLSYSLEYKGGLTATSTVETVASNEVKMGYKTILEQTIEYVNESIKDNGTEISYGVEEPPNPKEGDVWFKYNGPDTEIWIYEKIGEPDIFDWVLKISSAVDDSIKDKIEELEQTSKDISESVDKALEEAEKSLELAGQARETAFNSENVSMKVKADLENLDYKTNNYVLESSDDWQKIVLNDDIETTIVTVHYKTEKEIIKTEKKELELGSDYIFKAKLFEGYTLSDTAEKKLTVTEDLVVIFMYTKDKKETTVTVIHRTEDEVLKEDKKTLFVGDNHVFMSSEFDGYVLVGDKTQTITIVEDLVVTFLYEKKEVIEYTEVQVEYIDREKNRLIDRETLTLEVGTTYTFERKEIEGYTLDDEASKTKIISKDLIVHFYYKEIKKISEVTVNYIDQKANAVIKAETKQLETGSEHVFEAKKIEGYVLVSDYEQKIIISDNLVVNFYYEPEIVIEKATVIVKYVSTSTSETLHTFNIESEIGKTIDIAYKSVDGLELKDDHSKRVEVIENNQVVIFYVEKEQVNLLIDDYEIKSIANQKGGYQYYSLWEYTNGSLANTAEPGDKLILSYLVTGDVPKNPNYFMLQSDGNITLSSWLPFGEMQSGKRHEISFEFKSEYTTQTDSKKIGLLLTSFAGGEVLKVSEPKLLVLKAPKKMQFRSFIAPSFSKSMLRNVSTVESKPMLRNVSTVEFDEKSGESKKIAEIDILPLNKTLIGSETLTSVLVDASSDCTIVLGQENAIGKEELFEGGIVLKEGFLECICDIKKDTHKINIYIKNSTDKRNVVKYKNLQLQKGNIRLAWSPASKDIVLSGKFATFEESVDGFRRTVVDEQAGIKSEQSQMYNQINMNVKRVDGLSSDVTILSNQINLKVDKGEFDSLGNTVSKQQSQIKLLSDNIDFKVSANEVISRINMSPERIRIDSKLIHLSGQTLIDDAVIKNVMIANGAIDNAKIQDATISDAKIISVTADKIVANTLSAITSNTGTLNVTGWMNLLTDNNGIRGSYDYGDALGVYNARWFEGDFLLAKRMLMFSGDIYNLTASGGKGSYRHTSGTILGNDHLKFRAYHSNNTSNDNIRSRIDISADMIEISDNFNPKAVRASIAANGRAYFEGVATGVINAGEYYNTLKLNSEWRNWLGTITMTSSENGVWINENTGIGNAQMMFGRDSAGARIYSMDLYNRTYSGNAEVVITPAGTLGRRTSARKYKADIITSESVIKNAKKVLELKPVSWLDRAELDRGEATSRYHGFIADEFDSIGLKEVVIYNEHKEVEGLAYDRISMYHNVILSDHEDRLKRLERMLIGK